MQNDDSVEILSGVSEGDVVLYTASSTSTSSSMMMGMSICWICGFGFTPENRWLRRLLSLPVGWTMLLIGAWQVFS